MHSGFGSFSGSSCLLEKDKGLLKSEQWVEQMDERNPEWESVKDVSTVLRMVSVYLLNQSSTIWPCCSPRIRS